jgi:3-hydroxybutyryl-CoA dehydratase
MNRSLVSFEAGQLLPACDIAITQQLIDHYAALSGDFNPIHIDPAAGAASAFGSTIAHGCIPLEPVFQSILRWSRSDRLPPGTRLHLRYRAPSRPGDTVRSQVQLLSVQQTGDGAVIAMTFSCHNTDGTLVLDGTCEYPA